MSSPMGIIKEYLVSLGFEVDDPSYRKINDTINDLSRTVQDHTGGMAANYVKAGGIIAGALASVGVATVGLLRQIADADMEYQKFGLRMFMTRDAAKEMKIATDALGESLDDIAWMPELRERYYDLRRQARGMGTPKEQEKELRYLRDIRFEFTRMKVEATYGMQWIGHHLFKYLSGPITKAREGLKKFNDWIQEHMPEWTEKIARIIATLYNVGDSVFRVFAKVLEGLGRVWNIMPGWAKGVSAALTLAFAPIAPAYKLLGIVLALLEDFFAFKDGRKSSTTLAPIWETMIDMVDKLTWNIVLATAMVENFFAVLSGGGRSFSDVWGDVQSAWSDTKGPEKFGPPKPPTKTQEKNSDMRKSWAYKVPMLGNLMELGARQREEMEARGYQAASPPVPSAAGGGDTTINMGGVNVEITQPGASPQQVQDAVTQAIKSEMSKETSRNTRDLTGALQ
jgi:hypothetical protein